MRKPTRSGARRAVSKQELAVPVSARVEIRNVALVEAIVRCAPMPSGLPDDISANVLVTTVVDKKSKVIRVQPRFILVGKYKDSEKEQVRIEAMFVLLYDLPSLEGLRKENFDAFGEVNGLYNVWPYLREFVQNATVRMGLPPLTIPVFRPIKAKAVAKSSSMKKTVQKGKRKTSARAATVDFR